MLPPRPVKVAGAGADLECDIPAVFHCSVVPLTFGSEFPKVVELDVDIPAPRGQRRPFNSGNPLEKEEAEEAEEEEREWER